MKIEKCRIRITSEKEFNDVSKICLDNGLAWCDSDNTYGSITMDNKILIVCDDETSILYDTDSGSSYNKTAYKEFISKYGKQNEKEVAKMKIEPCKIKITSRTEFDEVERICFANNLKWEYPSDNKYNQISTDVKIITIDSRKRMLYDCYNERRESEYITLSEFRNRFTGLGLYPLRTSLFKTKKPSLDQTNSMVII